MIVNQEENSNSDKQKKRPPDNGFNFQNNRFAFVVLIVVLAMVGLMFFTTSRQVTNEIPYSQFLGYLQEGQVQSVRILDQSEIVGLLKSNSSFRTLIPYFDNNLVEVLREKRVQFSGEVKPASIWQILLNLLPWIFILFFAWFMFRQIQSSGSRAFSFGRSTAKRYHNDDKKRITFDDVAGQYEAKEELQEIVEFLKTPEQFLEMGARIPRGVLLVGSPGTGKTLLARASAGEANVAFFHMSGSDFVEMFVGVGASRVRDLFQNGKKNAPCILFIDELDAVGRVRGAGYGGGHDEREQTLNQLLVEMDGFGTHESVIVMAATNRPDVLDSALLRPGRFDRQVYIDMPDQKEREEILKIHSKKLPLAKNVELGKLARALPGTSGADLANLTNEAALHASRHKRKEIEQVDFDEARDKMLMGLARKSRIITDDDRLRTARHEAGHALLHYYLERSDNLYKVTIVPRGRSLGAAFSLPERDVYSRGKGYLLDRIKICYGGYVAEEMFYQETSTGVQQDLKMATDIARKMVLEWGMSDIGAIAFGQEDEPIFLGKEIATHKDYSNETANRIDAALEKILSTCMNEVRTLLNSHRDDVETLSQALLEHETMNDEEIRKLLNYDLKDEQEIEEGSASA